MREKTVHLPNNEFLPQVGELIAQGKNVTIPVRGRSMRPFLEDNRDCVVLSPFNTLAVGDAVLAQTDAGNYVLHRIIKIEGRDITLQGDGNLYGTERCTRDNVLGVLTTYVYPRHRVQADDSLRRINVRLWRWLRPVRRYLLFIYRKTFIK